MKKCNVTKKALLLTLGVVMTAAAACMAACNKEKATYTITFKQKDQTDQVYVVEEGEDFTNVPNPASKTGYTVVWNVTDFSNITSDIVVKAIESPNTYTITYDANGGMMSTTTQEVVYDSTVTLATAVYEGYDFIGWTLTEEAGGTVVLDGVWKLPNNVTLVANWAEKEKYTVTFRQNGQTLKVVELTEGTELSATDVPTPVEKTGYTVAWNAEQLAAAYAATEGNLTVDAVETAKKYKVKLVDGSDEQIKEFTYDQAYDLGKPSKSGYTFDGWYLDNVEFAQTGTWTMDATETVVIEAKWTKNAVQEEDDDRNWTSNY